MVKKLKKSKTEEKTKKNQKGKKIKNKKKTKKEKDDKSLQKLKEIRKFYVNKKQSQMTKVQALKYLKSMVEKYDFDKNDMPFSEYLEERARKSEKINQIVETSQIFTDDDVMSLTNYLEDNDFTDHDLSDIEPDYDNKNKKTKKVLTQNINPNGPLNGKTIVLTGEMMIDRDDLKVILMNLGARVTSAVSSKTSMLIHGEYFEDGRKYTDGKKYQMAKKNKIEIYSDKEFEKYMQKILKRKWNMKNEAKK
jgi:NAD-dependent DNA ligase